jgi:hypothetical protein
VKKHKCQRDLPFVTYTQVLLKIRVLQYFSRFMEGILHQGEYVHAVDALVVLDISHLEACSMIGLSQNYYVHFKKLAEKIDALGQGEAYVFKTNEAVQKIHLSHQSLPTLIWDGLSHFMFEMRQHTIQIQVSIQMMRQEVCCLLPSFGNKEQIYCSKEEGVLMLH